MGDALPRTFSFLLGPSGHSKARGVLPLYSRENGDLRAVTYPRPQGQGRDRSLAPGVGGSHPRSPALGTDLLGLRAALLARPERGGGLQLVISPWSLMFAEGRVTLPEDGVRSVTRVPLPARPLDGFAVFLAAPRS